MNMVPTVQSTEHAYFQLMPIYAIFLVSLECFNGIRTAKDSINNFTTRLFYNLNETDRQNLVKEYSQSNCSGLLSLNCLNH